jgi:para-aminobenzoate synthetase/4-amino-4-deoxychorismate lyase
MRLDDAPPFVLLDDARADGAEARFYRAPVRIVRADRIEDVPAALAALRAGQAQGLEAAGFIAYAAAAAFEPAVPPVGEGAGPLLWFGLFDGYRTIARDDVPMLLGDPDGAWIGPVAPEITRDQYDAMLAQVLDLIRAGDIYQANLTFRARVPVIGHPLAAYAQLRAGAQAGYGAVVMTGRETLLSLSPELFFALDGSTLTARPMKGTARRGLTADSDAVLARELGADAKQRAENLMIVDLLRNDLSRVARAGSVDVPDLFTVETYPTVHQMVSTVTADLAAGCDAIDVLTALFPCGSITGAPKIRAMEIIAAVEQGRPRGIYTGAIGRIDASGDAIFNVAIRTLVLAAGADDAVIGLGSGIVADSQADAEWDECLAKADFLHTARRIDLIETMAFHPAQGIALLERHLTRMKESANRLGFAFDRHAARNELQAATFALEMPSRVRLLLAPSGAIAIETAPAPPALAEPVDVVLMPLPLDPADFRLRHKTSDRGFYDDARAACAAFEVLFTDPQGRLTEGSFTSIFVERDGGLVTPPLQLGLLPGVLRAELIDTGRAAEAVLTAADLSGGFWIGNALRGLIPARLVAARAKPGL